jgi:hypothetical protein
VRAGGAAGDLAVALHPPGRARHLAGGHRRADDPLDLLGQSHLLSTGAGTRIHRLRHHAGAPVPGDPVERIAAAVAAGRRA